MTITIVKMAGLMAIMCPPNINGKKSRTAIVWPVPKTIPRAAETSETRPGATAPNASPPPH